MPETDDRQELAASLAAAVDRGVDEDWKGTKGPVAEAYATENFSVVSQVSKLLAEVDRLTSHDPTSTRARAQGPADRTDAVAGRRQVAGTSPAQNRPRRAPSRFVARVAAAAYAMPAASEAATASSSERSVSRGYTCQWVR